MGMYISWDITVQPVDEEQADALDETLEWYSHDSDLNGDTFSAVFASTSINASDDIDMTLREFTACNPQAVATVYVQGECDICPDKWVFEKGDRKTFVGSVQYTEVTTGG